MRELISRRGQSPARCLLVREKGRIGFLCYPFAVASQVLRDRKWSSRYVKWLTSGSPAGVIADRCRPLTCLDKDSPVRPVSAD